MNTVFKMASYYTYWLDIHVGRCDMSAKFCPIKPFHRYSMIKAKLS